MHLISETLLMRYVVLRQAVGLDLTELIPGQGLQTAMLMNISRLKPGTSQAGLAIVDPLTDEPGIAFAMENSRTDRIYVIGARKKDQWT